MIIPYYDSLIIECKNGQISPHQDDRHIIKLYFQQFFGSCQRQKEIVISILAIDHNQQSFIKEPNANMVRQVLLNLKHPLFQINNTYTFQQQIYLFYQGLSNITCSEAHNNKAPANVSNLTKLKEYYSKYKSDKQMKHFLKSLLVSNINHEKRTIKYSTASQIQNSIHNIMKSIKGNIRIVSNQIITSPQNIRIIAFKQSQNSSSRLEQLIKTVQTKFKFNKFINKNTTNQYTIKRLEQIAKQKLHNLCLVFIQNHINMQTNQIVYFSKDLTFMGDMKNILLYGLKLAEQERILKQQFLAFVQQMNVKYSAEITKYISCFRQRLIYKKQIRSYKLKLGHKVTIIQYFKSFINQRLYDTTYRNYMTIKCVKIQKRIRSLLINKNISQQMMRAYLTKKQSVHRQYKSNYSQIKDIFNQYQLNKLFKFNKYKYGFSCCLQILDIQSQTNHFQFRPSSLGSLVQKANKHKDLLTKIYCHQDYIQIYNIEGKMFRLGQKTNQKDTNLLTKISTNKQNQNPNKNNSTEEFNKFHSMSNKLVYKDKFSNSTQTSQKGSLFNSAICFPSISQVSSKKKKNIIQGEDFQFYINQNSKLFGRGSNFYGQLGLADNPFIEQFTNILPTQKIKLISTSNYYSVAITNTNKIYSFGRQAHRFQQSFTPVDVILKQKMIIQDLICTCNDTFLLNDHNKIYSLREDKFIRTPKQFQLQFRQFRFIKTGGPNLQIAYLVGYWINSLDRSKKLQIVRWLSKDIVQQNKDTYQSMLIQNENYQNQMPNQGINQLSAILEQSYL